MKRRWLLLFAVFLLAVLGAGWLLVPFEQGRISQASCDKIQIGSSEQEVAELLGRPNVRNKVGPLTTIIWKNVRLPESFGVTQWIEDDKYRIREIRVVFNKEGRVTERDFKVTSFAEQIKRRLPAWLR